MGHKFSILRKTRFTLLQENNTACVYSWSGYNKQLSEKDYVIKEQPLRMAIIDSKKYLIK